MEITVLRLYVIWVPALEFFPPSWDPMHEACTKMLSAGQAKTKPRPLAPVS